MSADHGKCLIFSAPSGAGKTTIVHHLLETFPELSFSVSATTREKRPHETNGIDYHFMTPEAFRKAIDAGGFVEWEEVYPNQFYGTLKSEIDFIRHSGRHVVFDVDVIGGINLKKHFGDEALSVFVSPPNLESLRKRLESRGTDTPEKIKTRLGKAESEMAYASRFDKVLLNHDLRTALSDAEALVREFLAR
jgi:guanylate kinase